jgi:hypothetical protein
MHFVLIRPLVADAISRRSEATLEIGLSISFLVFFELFRFLRVDSPMRLILCRCRSAPRCAFPGQS